MNYDQTQNLQNQAFFTGVSGKDSINPESDNPQPEESLNSNIFNREHDIRALGGAATNEQYPPNSNENELEQLGQIVSLGAQNSEEPANSQALNPNLRSEMPSSNLKKLVQAAEADVGAFLKEKNNPNGAGDFYHEILEKRGLAR